MSGNFTIIILALFADLLSLHPKLFEECFVIVTRQLSISGTNE